MMSRDRPDRTILWQIVREIDEAVKFWNGRILHVFHIPTREMNEREKVIGSDHGGHM